MSTGQQQGKLLIVATPTTRLSWRTGEIITDQRPTRAQFQVRPHANRLGDGSRSWFGSGSECERPIH